jgi:HK97 family phage prohead protease
MPWHLEKGGGTCGASQWAVIKDSDGSTAGCHSTKAKAEAQMAALYANEDSKSKHLEPAIDLVRAVGAGIELRHDGDGTDGLGTLVLRFSRFNVWYEVDSLWEGLFLERTKPGSFKQTIREDRDQMRVLFNHGMDFQLGDKVLGPIDDLREEPDSPVGEVPLFDTTYNRDLLPGLKAGVYGSSMRMRVLEEKWDDEPKTSADNPKGIPERTILRVRVLEFGPVTFPANPDASAEMASAGVRSMTDQFYERLRQRDQPAYAAAARAAGVELPDFTGRPEPRRPGGGGSPERERQRPRERRTTQDPLADPDVRDRLFRMEGILK